MRSLLLVSAMLFAGSAAYSAQTIEQACLKSGRKAASRSLCGCVQKVADMTLSRSDQRKAVKFFADPQEAQNIRASRKARDDAFWERYTTFGEAAQVYCDGS